jgi:hypothetical protein
MNKTIPQLVGEITSLAVLITQNTKHDVFVDYQAHVCKLVVGLYVNGWQLGKEHIDADVYIDSNNSDEAIKRLTEIKKQLVQIGLKNKLNFSKLPYEIEEIKHYKLI